MEMLNKKDYDVTPLFQEERQPPRSPLEYGKIRADRLETEAFYLTVRNVLDVIITNDLLRNLFVLSRLLLIMQKITLKTCP